MSVVYYLGKLYLCRVLILKIYIMCKVKETPKARVKKCYLCKETEHEVTDLYVEGNRYVCDNCITNR